MGDADRLLTYVEHCLPAGNPGGRIATAQRLGLGLELADRPGLDVGAYRRADVRLDTLQAYGMHESHPLHPDPVRREAAVDHVRQTIRLAADLGIPRVLTACGFGAEAVADHLEHCIRFYTKLAPVAQKYGVRIMVELLSPKRAPAMTDPADIDRLLASLGRPELFTTCLDTGHLLDAGLDPEDVLGDWPHPVEELQLRGPDGAAPSTDLPLAQWLAALPRPPAVVAVEHRETISVERLEALISHLRSSCPAA